MKIMTLLLAVFCLLPAVGYAAEQGKPAVLIVYYSRSGRTKAVAERLQDKTGADIYEIRTVLPYPAPFQAVNDVVKHQLAQNELPEIIDDPPDSITISVSPLIRH